MPLLSVETGAERIVHGPGQFIQEREAHFLGRKDGETVTASVLPEEVFGEPDEANIVTYDRNERHEIMGQMVSADTAEGGPTIRTLDG